MFDASLGRGATATPAGSIATSEATQRLCEGYFEFRARGPTAVKGLHATVEVYEVVRAGPLRSHFQLSTRRGLTKFVGREREMEALKHAAARARSGHGQIVAALAKPRGPRARYAGKHGRPLRQREPCDRHAEWLGANRKNVREITQLSRPYKGSSSRTRWRVLLMLPAISHAVDAKGCVGPLSDFDLRFLLLDKR